MNPPGESGTLWHHYCLPVLRGSPATKKPTPQHMRTKTDHWKLLGAAEEVKIAEEVAAGRALEVTKTKSLRAHLASSSSRTSCSRDRRPARCSRNLDKM